MGDLRRKLGTGSDGQMLFPYGSDNQHTYSLSKRVTTDWERFVALTKRAETADPALAERLYDRAFGLIDGPPFRAAKGYSWAYEAGVASIDVATAMCPLPSATAQGERLAFLRQSLIESLCPDLLTRHSIASVGPEECNVLHKSMGGGYHFLLEGGAADVYSEWWSSIDHELFFRAYRDWLSHLYRSDPRPLILKSPFYLLDLQALRATFPDSMFVAIRRSVTESIESLGALITSVRRLYGTPPIERRSVKELIVPGLEKLAGEEDGSGLVTIEFKGLIANPALVVGHVLDRVSSHFEIAASADLAVTAFTQCRV